MSDNVQPAKHPGGRPPKYSDGKVFAAKIEDYFNRITVTKSLLDNGGNEVISNAGQPVMITEYIEIPSVLGICIHLGINKDTWLDYESKPEFSESIKAAKARVEQYLADQLQRPTQVAGIIFNLKNNFGWADKQEIEYTGANGGPIQVQAIQSLSDDQLRQVVEIMEAGQKLLPE